MCTIEILVQWLRLPLPVYSSPFPPDCSSTKVLLLHRGTRLNRMWTFKEYHKKNTSGMELQGGSKGKGRGQTGEELRIIF